MFQTGEFRIVTKDAKGMAWDKQSPGKAGVQGITCVLENDVSVIVEAKRHHGGWKERRKYMGIPS